MRLELKAARVRKGWTQLHLAVFMSVSQQTVAKWELGYITPSSFKKLRQLESALGVPMQKLFPDVFEVGGEAIGFDGSGSGQAIKDQPVVSV